MVLVYAKITLQNPIKSELKVLETKCLVDTGSTYLCIPENVCIQLGLQELEKREVMLASGQVFTYPYVGPVRVSFDNRTCFTGALVLGNEVLLGAIPMEDMDLIIHPRILKLSVHPERPNIAGGIVK